MTDFYTVVPNKELLLKQIYLAKLHKTSVENNIDNFDKTVDITRLRKHEKQKYFNPSRWEVIEQQNPLFGTVEQIARCSQQYVTDTTNKLAECEIEIDRLTQLFEKFNRGWEKEELVNTLKPNTNSIKISARPKNRTEQKLMWLAFNRFNIA